MDEETPFAQGIRFERGDGFCTIKCLQVLRVSEGISSYKNASFKFAPPLIHITTSSVSGLLLLSKK